MRSILGTVWCNNRTPDEGARRSLREGLKAQLVAMFPELEPIYCGSINVYFGTISKRLQYDGKLIGIRIGGQNRSVSSASSFNTQKTAPCIQELGYGHQA
jgi:hypothetical protein